MKSYHALENQFTRHLLLMACATALAVACTVALPQPAHAADPVPNNIKVPDGNRAFLEGHAVGTQNYICLPSGWTFFGPQATLFDVNEEQIITHFLSPNPDPADPDGADTPRATWQHSQDTSTVWARATASSSNPGFVESGAIPWLLLQVVGAQDGPTNGETLTATTYIQRLNISGGIAPSTGCAQPADVGKKVLVPYEADYVFYTAG
jgi:Protein of unknown function (DUF3455)